MRAREGLMQSRKYADDLQKLYPVVEEGLTDSGSFDNVLEFLCKAGGRTLPEAAMTMVPEAWEKDQVREEWGMGKGCRIQSLVQSQCQRIKRAHNCVFST
jgi:glutamate synthase domain-containing protein 1